MSRRTPFRSLLNVVPLARLLDELSRDGVGVSRQTVHRWRIGTRRPDLDRAKTIMRISQELTREGKLVDQLTIDDFPSGRSVRIRRRD